MAKYSPGKAKMAASRAKTYPDARDAMLAERCGCSGSVMPPQEVIDAAAEQWITGGWNVSPENMCPRCFVARTASGICPLCEEE